MNIFVLDKDPETNASWLCDVHVSKMTLETAQILSSAYRINTGNSAPYKLTHRNHPCVLWAARNIINFHWLTGYGLFLDNEFYRRRGRHHKSGDVIRKLSYHCPDLTDRESMYKAIDFVKVVPDTLKHLEVTEAYKTLYRTKQVKWWVDGRPMTWTGREKPEWMI